MQSLNRVPRLYVTEPLAEDNPVHLRRDQAHYVNNVMRLGVGGQLRLFNGADGEWLSNITDVGKRNCTVTPNQQTRTQSGLPDIYYLFAPLKHARLDYMVQKATELGVAVLQPVLTDNTNVQRVKIERMTANAIEAAEQCNLLCIPEVRNPLSLSSVLSKWEPERKIIFCDEAASQKSAIAALKDVDVGPLAVLVGPEGGFSENERNMITALPFVITLSLGPRIMRADTAAVACLALVQAMLGDWH